MNPKFSHQNQMAQPEHYSIEYQAIENFISKPSSWLVRSGISLIMLTSILILFVCWIVKYPDKINAPFILNTANSPLKVLSPGFGRLDKILIKNNQQVSYDQAMAVIESSSKWQDVQTLDSLLFMMSNNELSLWPLLPSHLNLGTLQASYLALKESQLTLKNYLKNDLPFQQIDALKKEVEKNKILKQSFENQFTIYSKEHQLSEKEYLRQRKLFNSGVISPAEMEQAESKFLLSSRQQESMSTSAIQLEVTIENLKTKQLELQADYRNNFEKLEQTMYQKASEMRAALSSWKQQYLITSPCSGVVTINQQYEEGRYINAGECIMNVIQKNSGKIIAYGEAPMTGLGKIQIGCKVLLKLDAYPSEEYGIIISNLSTLSTLSDMDKNGNRIYRFSIELKDDLFTTYHVKIPFRQDLTGAVEIITAERRLIDRIISPFVKLFH